MNDKIPKNPEEYEKDETSSESEIFYADKSALNKSRSHKKNDRSRSKAQNNANLVRPEKMDENDFNKCVFVTNKLSQSVYAFSFRTPPDPNDEDAVNFLQSTQNPMDFQTLTNNLNNGVYKTIADWRKDITLIFDNSLNYYPPKSMPYESAEKLKTKFIKYNNIFTKTEEELWMAKIERICSEYISAENEQ